MADLTRGTYGRPFAASNRAARAESARQGRSTMFILNSSSLAHATLALKTKSQATRNGDHTMLKKLAAIGVSAAIAFAPLAALAQTDQAAPAPGAAPAATDQGAMAPKPKKKAHHAKKKPAAAPASSAAPAPAANPQ
jgi:hypothetical protein